MIKNYKQFNESIKHLLVGPTEDEVIYGLKDNPDKLLHFSLINKMDKGIKVALNYGADKRIYDRYINMWKWFEDLVTDMKEVKNNSTTITYFSKNGDKLFKLDKTSNSLNVNYEIIWSNIMNKYYINNKDVRIILNDMLEKYLNWKGLSLICGSMNE